MGPELSFDDLFQIRLARPSDIPALRSLIDRSVHGLQAADYSPAQIEGALGTVFGVDTQLIADETYFVAERADARGNRLIAGCGGWSKRKTLFGADRRPGREDDLLDPLRDNARIRAFFVHPDWTRRGVGTRLLKACEDAAIQAGFRGFELGATLTGFHLYAMRRYRETERIDVPLPNGASLPIIRMSKKAAREDL